MDNIYFLMIIALATLAIADLVVGVSNDAVNFLNSAIGSKAISFRTIMIVASAGIAFGAIFSSGMMEVELLMKKTTGRLNGYLGYSYSRALIKLNSTIPQEQVNNGEFFSANFDKPHDLSLVGNYRFNKRLSASANFIYQTGRPITYPVGKFVFANEEQVLYSDRNQFRIPDYYRLDLGVNIEGNHKKKKLGHSFVNISVYNVLGRNNPYSVFFVNEEGRIKAFKTSIFSIPVPTITYNFKF